MIDQTVLEHAARRAAMGALEQGVREGATYMCELLRAAVSGPGNIVSSGPHGRGVSSPFRFRRKTSRGGRWENYPQEWEGAQKFRHDPPGVRTGAGRNSIGYQIKDRDDAKGTITFMIGVDASAPGGMTTLASYLLGHDFGIRYPTIGPMKGSGPVLQRPWFRSTIDRYWESFSSVIVSVATR